MIVNGVRIVGRLFFVVFIGLMGFWGFLGLVLVVLLGLLLVGLDMII